MRSFLKKNQPHPKYLIIDFHGGNDNILAIVAAARMCEKNDVKLIGITLVNGLKTL